MKRKYILPFLLLAGWLCGCEDHRDDNMLEPQVYLTQSGITPITIYDVETTVDCQLHAYCSGLEAESVPVSLYVDQEALDAYNEENMTTYQILPADYYSVDKMNSEISKTTRNCTFNISFDVQKMSQNIDEIKDCVLPLAVQTQGGIKVNKKLNSNVLVPNIIPAEVLFVKSGLEELSLATQPNEIEVTFPIYTDFENRWDCDLEIVTGQEVMDRYNEANHSILRALPQSAYTFETVSKMEAGVNSVEAKIRINKASIPTDDIYSVGFCLKSTSLFKVNPDNNIYVVRLSQPVQGLQKVDRSGWELANSVPYQSASGTPEKMIDGNESTKWEAPYKASSGFPADTYKCPFTIVWDMNKTNVLNGVELVRRNDSYVADLRSGYVEISTDNVNWTRVVDFDYETAKNVRFDHYFESVEARYLKLVITASNRSGSSSDPISLSEFYAFSH